MANRLAAETSPYLLQHAANPVDWQPWDEAALARARAEDRPILLSVGYSACHWCHVMAHESFEDPAVAAVMNELFVNVKVDREERPDLDQIYQTAHQMLTGRAGGWPLTLFLTPDGTPFFGGTYFPKTSRHGLPAFPDLCRQMARAYREKRSAIDAQNLSLRDALADLERRPATADFHGSAADLVAAARNGLLRAFDPRHGGFGGAPKFPHPTDLALLLRRPDDDGARSVALTTLARMAEGGLFDQLAGGFCRYSVDERWEIPHFEKMLYDNGQLLGLYAEAWRQSGEPLFAAVVERTAGWLMAEMQAPEGGYRAALDADSEGEEGKFYVWDRDEVRAALSPDEWRVAAPVWGLDGPPNFENRHWHLRVAATVAAGDEALLASARATLLARRGRRVRPGCDDKVLTAWNALAIAGMAAAARVFGRPDWLASARRALDFIRAALWRDGRLLAAWRAGKAHLPAYLDDHAFLLAALLELLRADFRPVDLAFATAIADTLLARFEDAADGGFFFTAHDHETLIHRPKPAFDNATPAGNGVAATALQRLGHLTGAPRYLAAARRTLDLFLPQLAARPVGASALLEALEDSERPPTLVILRGPAAEVADWQRRLADRLDWVLGIPNGATGLPPALAKPESATVNAWVCSGVGCLAPVADFEQLKEVLQAPGFPLDCRFAFSPIPPL